jgi:hypothetical protein
MLNFVDVVVLGVLEIVECVEGIVGRCVFIQYMLVLLALTIFVWFGV